MHHLIKKEIILFCLLIIIIDLIYPVTFTYDSGHYYSLTKILDGNGFWHEWDPVRGIIFPLYIKLCIDILGLSNNSLLLPMIAAHISIFIIFSFFFEITTSQSLGNKKTYLTSLIVFLFIILDPIIFGFYHVLLTEFITSLISVITCLLIYLVYKNQQNNQLLYSSVLIFSILAIIAYHLKQPYVGAVLFPIFLISLLLIRKFSNMKTTLFILFLNLFIFLQLGLSILLWNIFLPNIGLAGNHERRISYYLTELISNKRELINSSPIILIKDIANKYLSLANIFYYDQEKNMIIQDFSLIRASENKSIGYRMFSNIKTNFFPMPDIYKDPLISLENVYNPPLYINSFFKISTIKSNFFFSTLYLFLPLGFIIISYYIFIRKQFDNYLVLSYICSGSAFLNAISHAIIYKPIDRYIFWGYPLLLISFLMIIININNFTFFKSP
jgi:drug/metabolite transporter superfamily protein YnfA